MVGMSGEPLAEFEGQEWPSKDEAMSAVESQFGGAGDGEVSENGEGDETLDSEEDMFNFEEEMGEEPMDDAPVEEEPVMDEEGEEPMMEDEEEIPEYAPEESEDPLFDETA